MLINSNVKWKLENNGELSVFYWFFPMWWEKSKKQTRVGLIKPLHISIEWHLLVDIPSYHTWIIKSRGRKEVRVCVSVFEPYGLGAVRQFLNARQATTRRSYFELSPIEPISGHSSCENAVRSTLIEPYRSLIHINSMSPKLYCEANKVTSVV